MLSSTTAGGTRDFDDDNGERDDGDWTEPPKRRRDWKKALLVLGLGALSVGCHLRRHVGADSIQYG